jgi:hypothetical protein
MAGGFLWRYGIPYLRLIGVGMDKTLDVFLYFVAAMTMFSMLGAVYRAFNDQKGSAITPGTLFLVGVLIVFIPQLEVIKMLGAEAKLRHRRAYERSR